MHPELGRRESNRSTLAQRLRRWILVAVLIGGAYVGWVKFEWSRPTAELLAPLTAIGRTASVRLAVRDAGTGLRSLEIAIEAGGTRYTLVSEDYPSAGWSGSGVHEKTFDLSVRPRDVKMPEGPATLVVRATDFSWLNLLVSRPPLLTQPVEIDTTPPTVELLTAQHYMRLGGSDMVVYKTSPDAVRSGVEVDRYFFPAVKGVLPDAAISVAMFAVPQDLIPSTRPRVVAFDRAGNRRDAEFYVSVKMRRFPERTLEIDDDFLKRKVPDLLQANGFAPTDDLVAGYLTVNRELRTKSEEKIREVCGRSENANLGAGVFLRQPNSAPLSSFADRRTYTHDGKVIDSQTHLGYDLASLRLSPVAAAAKGKVVFAESLGIYGDAVILDHGLGVFTLYGHLSSIGVETGAIVEQGDTIGKTGETGLAGGDHLHFSVMLWGYHVDPVEWWDPKWIEDHITAKLQAFASPAPAGTT